MDIREIIFCLFLLCLAVAETIKCKCTKESETVVCYDGVCQGEACLMLHHPTMGIHYTCHTKGLKNGSCRNKTSKSGATVRICGCDATDFCNYHYWPDKPVRSISQLKADQQVPIAMNSGVAPSSIISVILFSFLR